jgi:hypothetical protein
MPLKKSVTIPKTKSEQATSHRFVAFLLPQYLDDITSNIPVNYTDMLGGITSVEKKFTSNVEGRTRLGDPEIFQNIKTDLRYEFTIKKVIFYKSNFIEDLLEVNGNGFIKQFAPLMIQEVVKNPKGGIKELTTWIDCQVASDNYTVDYEQDLLVVKNLGIKGARMLTKDNDLVGFAKQTLGVITSLGIAAGESLSILSNFNL